MSGMTLTAARPLLVVSLDMSMQQLSMSSETTSRVFQLELLLQRERGLNRNTCIWYVDVWELKLYFYPSAGGFKKKKKKKRAEFSVQVRDVSISIQYVRLYLAPDTGKSRSAHFIFYIVWYDTFVRYNTWYHALISVAHWRRMYVAHFLFFLSILGTNPQLEAPYVFLLYGIPSSILP